jgi:hypothetical protein
VAPASKAKDANEWVHRILGEERDIVIPVELAERFKVREGEIEAGRHDPRIGRRDQRQGLRPASSATLELVAVSAG